MIVIESICVSLEDCLAAEEGGIRRIELCSALELGGLTPSLGLFDCAKRYCRFEVMTMIRPRTGGFCYSEPELATMESEIELFRDRGAHGFVFGILDETRKVDVEGCRRLLHFIPPSAQTVFHRAFDATPDPFVALETLIDLGFTRLLTSGQKPTAPEGAALIKELIARADGRIEILPGGGIRASNMKKLLEDTGADQLHMTFFGDRVDPSMSGVHIEFNARRAPEDGYRVAEVGLIREAFGIAGSPDC